MEAFFEGGAAEIDQQSDGEVEKTQVSQDLLGVDGGECFNRFQFHDHHAFDQQIDAESGIELHFVEFKRDGLLPLDA